MRHISALIQLQSSLHNIKVDKDCISINVVNVTEDTLGVRQAGNSPLAGWTWLRSKGRTGSWRMTDRKGLKETGAQEDLWRGVVGINSATGP
jgi:hypothetical protein